MYINIKKPNKSFDFYTLEFIEPVGGTLAYYKNKGNSQTKDMKLVEVYLSKSQLEGLKDFFKRIERIPRDIPYDSEFVKDEENENG